MSMCIISWPMWESIPCESMAERSQILATSDARQDVVFNGNDCWPRELYVYTARLPALAGRQAWARGRGTKILSETLSI